MAAGACVSPTVEVSLADDDGLGEPVSDGVVLGDGVVLWVGEAGVVGALVVGDAVGPLLVDGVD